jgi:hypothetical protein
VPGARGGLRGLQFASAYPITLVHGRHEHAAVADFASARALNDRLHHLVHDAIRHDDVMPVTIVPTASFTASTLSGRIIHLINFIVLLQRALKSVRTLGYFTGLPAYLQPSTPAG